MLGFRDKESILTPKSPYTQRELASLSDLGEIAFHSIANLQIGKLVKLLTAVLPSYIIFGNIDSSNSKDALKKEFGLAKK